MFTFTCLGWLIFRETHIARLAQYASEAATLGDRDAMIATTIMLVMCLLCALPLLGALLVQRHLVPKLQDSPLYLPLQTSLWGLEVYAVLIFVRTTPDAFIYFQF